MSTVAKIKRPPIVGILPLILCVSGVNSRAFDLKKRRESAINGSPNTRENNKEVSKEATARTLT